MVKIAGGIILALIILASLPLIGGALALVFTLVTYALVNFENDYHWDEYGHSLVAEEIIKFNFLIN